MERVSIRHESTLPFLRRFSGSREPANARGRRAAERALVPSPPPMAEVRRLSGAAEAPDDAPENE